LLFAFETFKYKQRIPNFNIDFNESDRKDTKQAQRAKEMVAKSEYIFYILIVKVEQLEGESI